MNVNDLTEEIISAYLSETRELCTRLCASDSATPSILSDVEKARDNSQLLSLTPLFSLFSALTDLYETALDGKFIFTENTKGLVGEAVKKIRECCALLEERKFTELNEVDIHFILVYCDKAVTGEIFDVAAMEADRKRDRVKAEVLKARQAQEMALRQTDELIKIKSSSMAEVINQQEEMIARTYIISNQIDLLKTAIDSGDTRSLKDTYKLLLNDSQTLQTSLMITHDRFLSLMHDESFLKSHQELQGFFVFSNGEKYLIPSQFIFDIICANPLEYVTEQNQKYVVYIKEDERGLHEESEMIPVYALSSLLPGQPATEGAVLDTILLADYQSQRIGIIVDSMQKFVSIIKKPMPASFVRCPVFQGVAFDERYDMVPILYLPEIMKKFRSQRGYDVKIFEAYSQKHVNKVLVVDDSLTTRQIQNTILSARGFMVDEACDGIDAMEKIKKKQFDVIICDDAMPRMNGATFLDNIRRMENYATVPVVALSDAPLEKADAFVSKADFTREVLIQKIDEVLHE